MEFDNTHEATEREDEGQDYNSERYAKSQKPSDKWFHETKEVSQLDGSALEVPLEENALDTEPPRNEQDEGRFSAYFAYKNDPCLCRQAAPTVRKGIQQQPWREREEWHRGLAAERPRR